MKNALVLLAGGNGERLGNSVPKQFLRIGSSNLIEYFLKNLDKLLFDIIVITIQNKYRRIYNKSIKINFPYHNIKFCMAGETRQLSSFNSLVFLKKYNPQNVLIHDSARPLASNLLFKKIIKNLSKNNNCIPFIQHNDYIKSMKNNINNSKEIYNIQTPQGFKFSEIHKAHKINKIINSKDDSFIIESQGVNLKYIKGEKTNLKITYKEDLKIFDKLKIKEYRCGIGYDIHQINFKSKKFLKLCGIKIPHPPLIGHSDADVGYHAICDSILGSLSMKDIGFYFKNNEPRWKNANSKIFLDFCLKNLKEKNYKIVNLDINFICEKPNIAKYRNRMIKNLSTLMKTSANRISIKATTNEKIGFIGSGEGIAAESIVQIVNV
jgi:2-C-methyl-D-erythritol 4-phosphate cytidylyltransferase/2-C-methyl-D-erythritol 2,4-cyclodiphosphate synthase